MYNIDKKEIIRTFKLFYTGGSSMKKIRNILSIALVFVMLIGFAPVNVFAGDAGTQGPSPVVTGPTDTSAPGTGDSTGTENPTNGGTGTQQDAAEVLKKAKEEAETKINALAFLSAEEKTAAINEIKSDTVTTTEAVTQKLTAAETKNTEAGNKAKEEAKKELAKLDKLKDEEKTTAEKAIDGAKSPAEIKTALDGAKKQNEENKKAEENPGGTQNPQQPVEHDIIVRTTGNGTAKATPNRASKDATITVTADPARGYVVDRIVVKDGQGNPLTLSNKKYKNYYDDYPYYPNSRWYRGYDYDDYIRWCDNHDCSRYDYSSFKRWCKWNGYSYDYDDFKRWYDWDDFYDYRWYNRYNYNYSYNYQADFTMPASAVTVEVTFTSAPYWYDGYFYDYETGTYRYYYDDDYYYYRNRKNKKSNYYERQAEKDKKEEEEAKAKAEAEKQPQIYENKAVIAIGSNVLDKVSKNVHTVHQMDTPAYVNNGRVMLPLRFVAEALGLQVSWVPETKTVIIWDLTQRVEIPVKSNRIIVNGITYTSDVKPEIRSSRTMLPIANIARALGLIDGSDIIWNQYNKQVTLTRKVLSK